MIRTVLHHRKTLIQKCLCQYRLKIHMSKMCSSFSNHVSQPYIDIENTFHLESHKFRNTLYPDTLCDEILTQLKSCNSVQQVFDIFAANKNSFTSKHLCQAILVLRDIQKVFNKFYLDDFTKNITEQKYETGIGESHHSVFHVFQRELTSHEQFKELLSRINEECDNFDIDEAVCTMLYLQYLGVHLKHKTIQRLISHADKTFRSSPEKQFSYQTLSRYFSSFKFEDSLYSVLILSKALPTVVTHLEKCNDVYSLGQISVCLEIVKDLMNTDLKQLFQNKLVEILSTLNIQTIEETRSLMKILVFLNLNFWSEENVEIIQRLLLLLADYIHMLDIKEIMYIQRVFSNQLEPYIFLDRVQKRAERVKMYTVIPESCVPRAQKRQYRPLITSGEPL
ncbi:FAST kinase domain-containing protein 1, mitochondrial-like [Diaphorina citri]|uniref:FAST kinase domain-containing protein 1, mitochondrial-like n=1 Tax=Diaphorina citri TaxID=121845 RepID=A0A3Q0J8L4_DIACI|nr:FAST kinase domain-containing protein 1, mitochondrial-like [Diaphorina citri]